MQTQTTNSRQCSTPGCSNKHKAKGLCAKHYDALPRRVKRRMRYYESYPAEKKVQSTLKHRRANKEHYLDWHLKRNFGIGLDQYNQLLERQGCRCAICGDHQSELPKRLAVDHCHDTGIVRGLLCSSCNQAIGALGDTLEAIETAYLYLKKAYNV